MPTLDVEAVRAFVSVADLQSFTRAAQALGTTQGAVSVKIRRLEDRVGHRLIERTPRSVRLSTRGTAFLDGARELLAAHERAVASLDARPQHFVLGIASHVAGPEVPTILARLHNHDPNLTIEVQFESSRKLLDGFDQGRLDAAIVLKEDDRRNGKILARERFGWFAAQGFEHWADEPLRLAALPPACGVRDVATRALDAAGIGWTEVFLGGSSAILAAVSAGLAVAALAYRIAPTDAVDIGPQFGLPPLPLSEIVLHSSLTDPRSRAALRILAAAFREHSVE